MTQSLDPLLLPLQGKRLVEASAGTGKTWTIAALYLRLVLGHGTEQTGFGRPLPPENILVMTFTRAATRELSARIRARLAHAAQCFQGVAQPERDDVFLPRLLADYPSAAARQTAAWRLATAAQAMDEAAVLTIDAWCHRMLREHAFDSGQAFDDVLLADETALQQQAARDVWRQQVYPLSGRELDAVLALWGDPDALRADVFGSDRAAPDLAPPPAQATLAELCARLLGERHDALQALKTRYCEAIAAIRDWLLALVQSADCPLNRQTYGLRSVQRWCDALDAWCADPQRPRPDLKDDDWRKLTPQHMRSRCVKGRQVAPPAQFDAVQALRAGLDALPDPAPQLRAFMSAQVRQRLRALKSAAAVSGFADLLERLDSALAAPQGGRLRQRILEQFPVALIDEFQDTSASQFSVFDRLYAITDAAAPPPLPTAVLLIGDPKQSIYAFRGADIDSYLRARAATAGRHAVLGVNRRSTRELVDAVNRLFAAREQAEGPGAFHYREDGGAHPANPLPFIPAVAHGRPERLICAEGAVPAVRFCVSTVAQPKDAVRARFAELAAAAVVELLGDATAGFVRDDDGGAFTRLRPSDLAVLVRDANEAAAMRRALARRGVASVYLSDRDSVFASREAADLLRWLRAVAAPTDGALARAAFATATLGLDLAELAALATDDVVFEQRLALLAELHRVWQRQGVLPMLRQTLHRLNLPARWLAAEDGERRLTNVLHLAELLQAASSTLDGEQALIRWLQSQLQGAGGEEFTLRLESEADLVRVVTIHKSKGLEYPVVFLPFATACKPDGDRARERERLREDLRLLYVALTRARHALWIGVAAIQPHPKNCPFEQTAFGYLLVGQTGADAPDLHALLARLYHDQPAVRIDVAPAEAALQRLQRDDAPPALRPVRGYDAEFERDWGISSFSALVRGLEPRSTQDGALLPALHDELSDGDEPPSEVPLQDAPRHRVARGALAGKFVHEQLAWLAEHRFALDTDAALQTRLLQRCARQGWSEAQSQDLLGWLREVLATPLPVLGAALPEIDTVLAEMEFWFPVERASAAQIDALCCAHILPGRPRPPLTKRALHGMVMGFADLVFAHGGRYWVLDYKSNALGPGDANYTRQALEAAMLAHRYDVQCALYLLALHRLLRARLGAGYSPQQHLGGAIDWFLRGVRAPGAGCVHIAPTAQWIDALDALFAPAGEVSA